MKLTFKIGSWEYVSWLFRKFVVKRGVSSRIWGTLNHVLYLDYDNIDLDILEAELENLIDIFELGNLHIIESSENNYHVECHERFLTTEVLSIQDLSSCDALFRRGPTLNSTRGWIHRRSEKGDKSKPKYVKTLESPFNGVRLQSSFHTKVLERDFGVKVILVNPDGVDTGYEQQYETLRR